MSIPDSQTFLRPVLRVFGDDAEHSNEEIWERMRVQFKIDRTDFLYQGE